jgi:putative transposase
MVTPHPLYSALGPDENTRQFRYRELFRFELDPGLVDEIRAATNGNYALGSSAFQAQVANALARRVTRGKSGRPSKRGDVPSHNLFERT